MEQVNVNFQCDSELKAEFEKAIKSLHYNGITEFFREKMRAVVKDYREAQQQNQAEQGGSSS